MTYPYLLKIIFISILLLSFSGCAKYKGWEEVKIIETAIGLPCSYEGLEECRGNGCSGSWIKKRATLVGANSVAIPTNTHNGDFVSLYFCNQGLPSYEKLKFSKDGYEKGSNTVTGQAFLTQRDGGVITCAGNKVQIFPNTVYFRNYYDIDSDKQEIEYSDEARDFEHSTTCDSTGNFSFENIQSGRWILISTVKWDNPTVERVGSYSYVNKNVQGGKVLGEIEVKNNFSNKVILNTIFEKALY